MATRGLIGTYRKKGKIKELVFVYNHFDSYPAGLGNKLLESIKKAKKKGTLQKLKKEIESGKITATVEKDLTNIKNIDYLFHEWIYIIDFENEKFYVFFPLWDRKNILLWKDNAGMVEKLYDGILIKYAEYTFEEIVKKDIWFEDVEKNYEMQEEKILDFIIKVLKRYEIDDNKLKNYLILKNL